MFALAQTATGLELECLSKRSASILTEEIHIKYKTTNGVKVQVPHLFAGLYGKRSSSPSLTQFDFFHPFHGHTQTHQIARRSVAHNRSSHVYFSHAKNDEEITLLFHELLTTGLWYLTIINDGLSKDEFRFVMEPIDEKNERSCLNNCHNHGICQRGVCLCHSAYTGADCSIGKWIRFCRGSIAYLAVI